MADSPAMSDAPSPAPTAIVCPLPHAATLPTVLERLAEIPEEEIWLAKQKSARTRRAYRLDVRHFMATLGIASTEELRQAAECVSDGARIVLAVVFEEPVGN